jgi:hypothetical protein
MMDMTASTAETTTMRVKSSQKPAVSTSPAALLVAEAVGRRAVRRRAMSGGGREEK